MTTNLTRAEARIRSALITVDNYRVKLDLSNAKDRLTSTFDSTTTITLNAGHNETTFVDFIAESVTRLTVNGTNLDPVKAFDGARVTFPVTSGHNTVKIAGRARYSRSGEGLHRFFDPADDRVYLYTQYEPTDARRVFANFDQPDIKATFDFTLITPPDFVALSNGAEAVASGSAPTPPSAAVDESDSAVTDGESAYPAPKPAVSRATQPGAQGAQFVSPSTPQRSGAPGTGGPTSPNAPGNRQPAGHQTGTPQPGAAQPAAAQPGAAQPGAVPTSPATTSPATGQAVRHVFATTKRQSSYITCVAAGHYAAAHDTYVHPHTGLEIPLGLYARQSLADHMDAKQLFTITKQGLDFFHDLFDYPYPWGKYDQIFVPEYNIGAMENPGLVTFTDTYLYRDAVTRTQYESRANTILHEMTHMWFGDLVTMKWWDDLWLKESFADYMGGLALAEATEYTDGWVSFALRRKDWAYRQDQYPTTHPIVADIPDVEAAKLNFDGITYAKGASVLKQLVAYVGREAFTQGSRAYFRAHEFGNTTLTDFLDALQAAAPDRDVRAWAAAWLQTTGISEIEVQATTASALAPGGNVPDGEGKQSELPRYRARSGVRLRGADQVTRADAHAPASQIITRATIAQRNSDGSELLRPHTFQLATFTRARRRLERTNAWTIDLEDGEAEVPQLVGKPKPDLLLPNHGDDDFVKIRLDPESTANACASVTRLADPLDRALVWSALTNAMRDGLMPVTDFLSAYANSLGRETHPGISAGLRTHALTALDRWITPSAADGALADVLGSALDALRLSEPDSDIQLGLAELVLSLVKRSVSVTVPGPAVTAGRAFATQLLQIGVQARMGAEAANLRVDHSLRWQALIALVALGWADYDDIDAEAALDRTGSGALNALTARAARPLPIVKMRAFERATTDATLSNDQLSAVIRGFATPSGLPINEPFVERYFDLVGEFWVGEKRSIEIGRRLLLGLFPTWSQRSEQVLELTDAWLASHANAPAAQVRLLTELRDDQARALRLKEGFGRRGRH